MPTPTATIFLPYHALDDVILRGTRAAQPLASAVVAGTLYGVTDEGNLVERSSGTAWQAYSPIGGALAAHHATHEPGGTDPMAVDAVAATGSLRTLGTGPQQAAPGNDARFTAPSPPTAHATTHQPGGADAMTVDAVAATGSLRTLGTGANQAAPGNDARFAAGTAAHHASHEPGGADALVNAAWTNQANTFTQNQTLTKALPQVFLVDTSQPTNQRAFDLLVYNQRWHLRALTDDFSGVVAWTLQGDRAGSVFVAQDLYEKNRPTPMGHWMDVPYSASNFATNVGAWTVEAGDVSINRYTLIGKTLIWTLSVGATSLASGANYLLAVVPTGTIQSVAATRAAQATNNGGLADVSSLYYTPSYVAFAIRDGTNWAASANNTLLTITVILVLD